MCIDSAAPQSVIIIGAGMAGIKLAHDLLQHQPTTKITILEANHYIGGRMRSLDFQGHTVEMGANWISGLETAYQNPVWQLAKDAQLAGHLVDRAEERSALVVDSQGNDIHKEYFETMERFEDIYEKAISSSKGVSSQNDIDVRAQLDKCGWPTERSMIENLVEFNLLEVWISDSLDDLSVSFNMEEGANDVELGKDEFFVEDPRGFNCILNSMVDDIQKKGAVIKLNTQVDKVCYNPGNVRVTCTENGQSQSEYKADTIVCTTSLGVLQSNQMEFSPPLPEYKVKALNQVRMFVFSKVFAKFDDNEIWSKTKNQIIVCSDKRGYYPLWMRYRHVNENIFMCYLGGPEAKRVESLELEEIKNEIGELFRNAFGNKYCEEASAGAFRPSSVAVTDWSRNPRFCGSYSVFPVHSFSQVPIKDLTRGLTGTDSMDGPTTLHFAGEAFDDKYNGWVQGAYRSGERVAKSILGMNEQ